MNKSSSEKTAPGNIKAFAISKRATFSAEEARHLLEQDIFRFFSYGLHRIYPELGKPAAVNLLEQEPIRFFDLDLHKTYPELGETAATRIVERDMLGFFYNKFHIDYPEIGRSAAAGLAEREPIQFFRLLLHRDFPELEKAAAARLAEHDLAEFFYYKLHKTYPELGKLAATTMARQEPVRFFNYDLHKTYPELEKPAATKMARQDPGIFFSYRLHETYPELGGPAITALTEQDPAAFFRRSLNKTYPELEESAAINLAEWEPYSFIYYKLHKTYPELGRSAATRIAEQDLRSFFGYELHETYPELVKTIDKDISINPDQTSRDNFYSITKSHFQEQQRHPDAANQTRYEFAINNPLNIEQSKLESEILSSLFHEAGNEHSTIGIPQYTKGWALITLPDPQTVIVEQIQSDLPTILHKVSSDHDIKSRLQKEYGEDVYYNFIEKYAEFSAAYPYITIQKLAEMAKNNNITTIKISDAETMVDVASISNVSKANRIYNDIPQKLKFKHEGRFWVYSGDMGALEAKSKQLADSSTPTAQKPISKKPTKSRLLDVSELKPFIYKILGDRAEQLNFSEKIGDFIKSLNDLSLQGVVTNKEKNTILGQINKYVKATIENTLRKFGEANGRFISKQAQLWVKSAAIEKSSLGVGVSTSVRLYARKYYGAFGIQSIVGMRNADLNDLLAGDFLKAEPQHRFRLKSGEIAEIRKSHSFYYIAKMQGSSYDIIVVQGQYKEPPEFVRKHRLDKWVRTQSGTK